MKHTVQVSGKKTCSLNFSHSPVRLQAPGDELESGWSSGEETWCRETLQRHSKRKQTQHRIITREAINEIMRHFRNSTEDQKYPGCRTSFALGSQQLWLCPREAEARLSRGGLGARRASLAPNLSRSQPELLAVENEEPLAPWVTRKGRETVQRHSTVLRILAQSSWWAVACGLALLTLVWGGSVGCRSWLAEGCADPVLNDNNKNKDETKQTRISALLKPEQSDLKFGSDQRPLVHGQGTQLFAYIGPNV